MREWVHEEAVKDRHWDTLGMSSREEGTVN